MNGRELSRRSLLYGTPVAVGGAMVGTGDAATAAVPAPASAASPRDYGAVGDGVTDDTTGGARYAVDITGGSGMTVTGTRWRALGTGGVNNRGTGTVLSDNLTL